MQVENAAIHAILYADSEVAVTECVQEHGRVQQDESAILNWKGSESLMMSTMRSVKPSWNDLIIGLFTTYELFWTAKFVE